MLAHTRSHTAYVSFSRVTKTIIITSEVGKPTNFTLIRYAVKTINTECLISCYTEERENHKKKE